MISRLLRGFMAWVFAFFDPSIPRPLSPTQARGKGRLGNTTYLIQPGDLSPGRVILWLLTFSLIALTGCQGNNLPAPTVMPTITPSPTQSAASPTPIPTVRPIITATPAVLPTGIPAAPTATATAGPATYVAKQGDSIISILAKFGYRELSPDLLAQFRQLNGMPPDSNNIVAGETYTIPQATAIPTATGADLTQTLEASIAPELFSSGPSTLAKYTIRKGDDISAVQIITGATLRQLCELNTAASDNPNPIICPTNCNLDAAVGGQGCRVIIREGAWLYYPGPTPTPTITPTLTGSETVTPTPTYSPPRILAPVDGATVAGTGQLSWMSVGVLQPDEVYLVMLTDAGTQQTVQRETRMNAIPLPPELQPKDGQAHTIHWQVGVAQQSPDGAYVQISPPSNIYTFTWQGS